jgi:hypothetical protein
MAWARLDDSFYDHPKVIAVWHARPDALGLHMRAISYCARHETDGKIHNAAVMALSPFQRDREGQVGALVDAGLWYEQEEHYLIHDYLDYNLSRDEIAAKREADRERQAKRRKVAA